MEYIKRSVLILVQASDGNPVMTTVTVFLFMLVFNVLESIVEKLIFGECFVHFLDLLFTAAFIAYALYAIWECAEYNKTKDRDLPKW